MTNSDAQQLKTLGLAVVNTELEAGTLILLSKLTNAVLDLA